MEQPAEREELVYLPYELLPWQEAVKADRHRNRAVHAGRRSGKTHLLCDLEIDAALTFAAGLPCWYVAPTYGMAKDIAWGLLKDFTADLLRAGLVTRYFETELRIEFLNGASVHLKGADNQDSLRGRGLGFLGIDEIALMHRDVWLRVLRPATSDYKAPVVFIGTPKGYNYFYDLCEQEKKDPAQWKTFHIKTSEAGTLDPAEIAQARRDLDVQSFRQEYEASFEMFAGQIFHWDVGPAPVNGAKPDEVFFGLDFGYSVNPSVVVKVSRKADWFWVQELVYRSGLTNQDLGAAMTEAGVQVTKMGYRAGDPVYCDSAEPKSIEELAQLGFNVMPAPKGPDSVRAGLDFLKAQHITIVEGSENILREQRGYCWKADRNGVDLPEPMKFNDHAMDAIRYAIVTHMKRAGAYLGIVRHDVRPA